MRLLCGTHPTSRGQTPSGVLASPAPILPDQQFSSVYDFRLSFNEEPPVLLPTIGRDKIPKSYSIDPSIFTLEKWKAGMVYNPLESR
jgi:hypothetical protein